jgi:hypothetical protein
MDFLRRLFGGGGASPSGDRGLYVYVRPKMCKEILRVRVDPMNNLSESDEGGTYFVRKVATGQRCPFPVEITLYFDGSKRVTKREITNGEFVTETDYDAFVAQSQPTTTP